MEDVFIIRSLNSLYNYAWDINWSDITIVQ